MATADDSTATKLPDDYEKKIASVLQDHYSSCALTCIQATRGEVYGLRARRQFGLVLKPNNNHHKDTADTAAVELTLHVALMDDTCNQQDVSDFVYYVCQRPKQQRPTTKWYSQTDIFKQKDCFWFVRGVSSLWEYQDDDNPYRAIELRVWNTMSDQNPEHYRLSTFVEPDDYNFLAYRYYGRRVPHESFAEFFGAQELIQSSDFVVVPPSTQGITERFLGDLFHHTNLTELIIRNNEGVDTTLAHFQMVANILLCSTKKKNTIRHLWLDRYKGDGECMNCLLQALQHENTAVATLSLVDCRFTTDDATEMFTAFIQSITKAQSSIRELHIAGDEHMFGFGTTIGQTVAKMMIGSELETLTLEGFSHAVDVEGFCQSLASLDSKGTSLIGWSSWNLSGCYGSVNAVAQCLPQLCYLKSLKWDGETKDDPLPPTCSNGGHTRKDLATHLLVPLRSNGSLTSVTVDTLETTTDLHNNDSPMTAAHRIRAYCRRNEQLPILLSKPMCRSHGDNGADDKAERKDTELVKLFPSLLVVAQHAPRTAPTMMLIGLLSASNLVGPNTISCVRLRRDSRS